MMVFSDVVTDAGRRRGLRQKNCGDRRNVYARAVCFSDEPALETDKAIEERRKDDWS